MDGTTIFKGGANSGKQSIYKSKAFVFFSCLLLNLSCLMYNLATKAANCPGRLVYEPSLVYGSTLVMLICFYEYVFQLVLKKKKVYKLLKQKKKKTIEL